MFMLFFIQLSRDSRSEYVLQWCGTINTPWIQGHSTTQQEGHTGKKSWLFHQSQSIVSVNPLSPSLSHTPSPWLFKC
ncbi:hypothetical protein AAFF_G00046020 [Aldrovandia affinis]|uniref:Uncharacterized protein n=1 Tax=Aldrovandia affinis TaxID=143900 RepID=A0AAD7WER4_9TELE|nr:hypothetical protein AAFF_G00046020 [Aldrovandia affinis]